MSSIPGLLTPVWSSLLLRRLFSNLLLPAWWLSKMMTPPQPRSPLRLLFLLLLLQQILQHSLIYAADMSLNQCVGRASCTLGNFKGWCSHRCNEEATPWSCSVCRLNSRALLPCTEQALGREVSRMRYFQFQPGRLPDYPCFGFLMSSFVYQHPLWKYKSSWALPKMQTAPPVFLDRPPAVNILEIYQKCLRSKQVTGKLQPGLI